MNKKIFKKNKRPQTSDKQIIRHQFLANIQNDKDRKNNQLATRALQAQYSYSDIILNL